MSLNFHIFAKVVTTILHYFLSTRKAERCSVQARFDVELAKSDNLYLIHVTNCGYAVGDCVEALNLIHTELSSLIEFHDYFERIAAFTSLTNGQKLACDLQNQVDRQPQTCLRIMASEESRRFAHLDEYQSFELKCKILANDLKVFKEYLTHGIIAFAEDHKSELDVHYTFHCGDQIIYESHDGLNRSVNFSKLISSAVQKILLRTTNEEFQKRCFTLLDISCAQETGTVVMSKLLSLLSDRLGKKKRDVKRFAFPNNSRVETAEKIISSSASTHRHQSIVAEETNNAHSTHSPIIMSSLGTRSKITKRSDASPRAKNIQENAVTVPSSASLNQQPIEDQENNRANSAVFPIIMSPRGRFAKRMEFFNGSPVRNIKRKDVEPSSPASPYSRSIEDKENNYGRPILSPLSPIIILEDITNSPLPKNIRIANAETFKKKRNLSYPQRLHLIAVNRGQKKIIKQSLCPHQ